MSQSFAQAGCGLSCNHFESVGVKYLWARNRNDAPAHMLYAQFAAYVALHLRGANMDFTMIFDIEFGIRPA